MNRIIPKQTEDAFPVEEYDLVILGSGEGSKYVAWTLAKQGQRVAVIEREYIGGSCPNIACLPSKNIIHSAKVASYFRRGKEFGIVSGEYSIDMKVVRERKRMMVKALVDIHVDNFNKSGSELVMGSGKFIAPRTLEVTLADGGIRRLRGANVIIGTGTRATLEPVPGLADSNPLTHIEALELDEVPDHLLIMGGGYIGLEFAQAMRRLGSKVTVIERSARLLPREDEDVALGLHALLADEGIDIVFDAQVEQVSGKSGDSVEITSKQGKTEHCLRGTHLLVATGRTPNTEGIGLDVAGVEVTERGYVKVNERLETTAPAYGQ